MMGEWLAAFLAIIAILLCGYALLRNR